MNSAADTIVAPITGGWPCAVAVVRVSGPEAWRVAAAVFGPWPAQVESHRAIYGHFVHGDDGLALPFEEGHGYTGEPAVELSVHGSLASVTGLLEACRAAGARVAEPGEFSLRAFMNGRIDLTEAEAVRDTVEAQTRAQLRSANLLREGALHRKVDELRDRALGLLALVEASVDFAEEIGELDRPLALESVEAVRDQISKLLASAQAGRLLRQGFRIAIVGPPNVGKSSLLNRLLGSERAIVTEVPGTTRDFVEERADFDGMPVVLIDTAGLRETEDLVESIGVQRSRAAAAHADEIWFLFDASLGLSEEAIQLSRSFESEVTYVRNKCDLGGPEGPGIPISALTGEGMPRLIAHVKDRIPTTPSLPLINSRHEAELREADEALSQATAILTSSRPDDLVAISLRQAVNALGRITGETAAPDMVERIFHDFCIGK